MAMNKVTMATSIIHALMGTTDNTGMRKLSLAIKSYIEAYCDITYSWVATLSIPPYTPDSTITYKAKVIFSNFNITLPQTNDSIVAFNAFGNALTLEINKGVINPIDPTFLVAPGTFFPSNIILTSSNVTTQKDAMEHLANEIIIGIKAKINSTPLPGTHLIYTVPTPGAIMTNIL